MNQGKTAVVVIHGIHPTARYEIQDLFGTQLLRRLNETQPDPKWTLNILWPKIAKEDAEPADVHATALRICRDENPDDPKTPYFDIFEAYWSPIDKNQTTLGKVLAWLADGIFVPLNASAKLYSSTKKVLFDLGMLVAVLAISLVLLAVAALAATWGYRIFAGAATCALAKPPPNCDTATPSLIDFILHPTTTLQQFAWPTIVYVLILFIGAYALTQLAISAYHTCAEAYRRTRVRRTAASEELEPRRLWRLWFQAALAIVAAFGLWWWPWFHPFVPDPTHRLMWSTLTTVAIVGFFRSALGTLNEFFVNTLGDVQIYTTHDENSAFYKFRQEIVELVEGVILQVLRAESGPLETMPVPADGFAIRGAVDPPPPPPLYDRVVVAAHSLGSTIGMDALINIHEMCAEGGVRQEDWNRLRAFVTFGSSLEKTKFFFDVKQPTVSASADHWRNDVYGRLFTNDFATLSNDVAPPVSQIFWANHWYPHDLVANRIESYTDRNRRTICENTILRSKFSLIHPWVHSDYLWDENFWRRPDGSSTHGMLDVLGL
jgi:hypothetical protein